MRQARRNLTGNARDLWVAGIRNIENQRRHLDSIAAATGNAASKELRHALVEAAQATDELVVWLREQAQRKTGPSSIGKE